MLGSVCTLGTNKLNGKLMNAVIQVQGHTSERASCLLQVCTKAYKDEIVCARACVCVHTTRLIFQSFEWQYEN